MMPADILIYALVAAGLVFWLRSVLGTRHGDERQRPNPFTSQNEAPVGTASAAPPGFKPLAGGNASIEEMSQGLERHMSIAGAGAEIGLVEIARTDRTFDLSRFMQGAQDAFIMVVEAFAEADRETLKGLLSESLYKSFASVLDERKEKGQTASVEIHAVRRAEVIDANVKERMAFITVRFISDETNLLRDEDDNLIYGNPERVTETIDIWTFGRDLRSRSPAWLVYETRDEDASEEEHKTVPDSD